MPRLLNRTVVLRRGLRLRTETPAIAGLALEAPSFSDGA